MPSFNRDKLLDAKLTSDNFGEVSNKWTPMKGKAFLDISATKKNGKNNGKKTRFYLCIKITYQTFPKKAG